VVPKPKPKPKPKPAATRAVVATNGKKKLVNVDDATIASMAVNTSFTSEFPILVAAKNYAGKSCSGCGGAARKRAGEETAAERTARHGAGANHVQERGR
jgi:hypothetical protein